MDHEYQRDQPRGLGALLGTDVERVDLGEHQGRRLRARVEHRRLQVVLGRRSSGGVTFGRRRVRTIEVTAADGTTSAVTVVAPPDPVQQMARRTLGMALVAWAVQFIAARFRHRDHDRISL